MWIRQLSVYELQNAEPETWDAALREHPIEDPAPGNRTAVGFAPMPAWGEEQEPLFVDHHNSLYAFMGVQTERHLPTDVVEREVSVRLKEHYKHQEAPPDKSAREGLEKEVRAQVITQLLDESPVKEKLVLAVYDDRQHRLYVFGAAKQAEDIVLAGLKKALGSTLDATPIISVRSPSLVLTGWLAAGTAPEPFVLGQDAELASQGEGGKVVFKGLDLDDELVRQHLEQGDTVTKLSLTWDGRLDLVITYKGEIQKIAPPGDKMKPQDVPNIWLDAMSQVIPMYDCVMSALGGAAVREANIKVHEKPIRVAVVAGEGGAGQPEHVFKLLDQLSQRRRLGELIIPTVPNDRMRAAFKWGAHKKLPIKTVKLTPDAERWAGDVIALKPRAVLTFGSGPEVVALTAAAADKKIPVMELAPNRA